jgi:hypothetical protein
MANAMVALANLTLGSAQATVTFSSIPATYRDLRLVCNVRTNRAATNNPMRLRVNGDSGNNYSRVAMYGDGSSPGSYTDTATEVICDLSATGTTAPADTYAVFNIDILDYMATDKHKSMLTVSDVAGAGTRRQAARWANTSAITSVYLASYFGETMLAGSTFSLYGIVA